MSPSVDLLIDDYGKVWPSHGADLRRRNGLVGAEADLASHVVRALGYIRLRFLTDQRGVRITIRDRHVAPQAIWQAIVMLAGYTGTRFIIEFVGEQSGFRVLHAPHEVFDVLVRHENAGVGIKRDQLFKQLLPLSRLDTDPRLGFLREQYKVWRQSFGNLELGRKNGAYFSGPNRNFLARIASDTAEFIEMGAKFENNLVGLVGNTAGKMITDQPDVRYAEWVGSALMDVAHEARPRLELCEVTVKVLVNQTARRRYNRVFLPWKSRYGIFISTASVMLTDLITVATPLTADRQPEWVNAR